MAVGSAVAGAALTALSPAPEVALHPPEPAVLLAALVALVLTAAAMGVDLPGSSRRLSRLA
jgi:hypothetical protein